MQKILIIADGIVAKDLLERVQSSYLSAHSYCVVAHDSATLPAGIEHHMETHRFDPTSRSKLASVIDRDYTQAMVVMEKMDEALEVIQILRYYNKELHIVVLDMWGIGQNLLALGAGDPYISLVQGRNLLVARMVDYLPSVPLIAQNIGLGQGEIMEVLVPTGSSYAYRHISNIEQKNGRIVALYRNNQLILAKPSLMIRPNDSLLLVGNPAILRSMHKAIKSEQGQFPSPYGKNIYCLIDMRCDEPESVRKIVDEALYLHGRLKNIKIVFRVLNPRDPQTLQYLKSLLSRDILVEIAFRPTTYDEVLQEDKRYNIGLIVVSEAMFRNLALRQAVSSRGKPVMKLGEYALSSIDQTMLLLEGAKSEPISATLFDLASQLGHQIRLCDFDPDGAGKHSVIEHYENQATLYGKKIDLIRSTNNPIREAEKLGRFVQVLPFSREVVTGSILALFAPSVGALHWKLGRFPQLFVPVEEKQG